MKQALFISSIVQGGGKRRGLLTFDAQPSRRLRTIRLVGNNQLKAGRPSGSGAKVRHVRTRWYILILRMTLMRSI